MLDNESCKKVNGFQVLDTCKTMLSLPRIRQTMINQAFNQGESRKNPCSPKLQQYINI
jgi:hypothetical protein